MKSSESDWRAHMVVILVGVLLVGFFCLMDSTAPPSRRGEERDEAESVKQAEAELDARADRALKQRRGQPRGTRGQR